MEFIEIGNSLIRAKDIKAVSKIKEAERVWCDKEDKMKFSDTVLFGILIETYDERKYRTKDFYKESERDEAFDAIKKQLFALS